MCFLADELQQKKKKKKRNNAQGPSSSVHLCVYCCWLNDEMNAHKIPLIQVLLILFLFGLLCSADCLCVRAYCVDCEYAIHAFSLIFFCV